MSLSASLAPITVGHHRLMAQIIIAGWIDLDPARVDECVAASIPLQRAAREEEPGCEAYVFAPDPVVPGRISVYERWADADALAAHFRHPNYTGMRDMLYAYGRLTSETLRFRIDAVASVYDEDHVPRPHRWPDQG